ncbi:hypothetical protein [Archangium lansingense]|uniref:Metallothionein n=1 Tax=Archangium lansingense TaxID=2995310 RepID=A0ABT4A690_9BACT|nr:hypothetical protein [Archangium lansinium]MCY1077140.1 hypothetical protein [Archangium lansinium]
MSRHVLIAVLCLSLTAFADTPNLFEPKELSSEAVLTFVMSCSEKVKQADSGIPEAQRLSFCSCAADALRLRHKQKGKDKAPSAEDLQRCANALTRSSPPEEVAGQLQSQPGQSPSEHKVAPASTQPDTSRSTGWEDSEDTSSSESPSSVEPARSCCKVCTKGCPCGDSCISCSKVCRKGPGCAC